MQNRQEIMDMVRLAINDELNQRGLMTKEQISSIVSESTNQVMMTTFKLMGVRFKDNGEIDFDHAYKNNAYVSRLRRGHAQIVTIIFNSCLATAVIAGITFFGQALLEHIKTVMHIPPKPPTM